MAILLALVSCTSEIVDNHTVMCDSFYALLEKDTTSTKVSLGGTSSDIFRKTYWSYDDKIAVVGHDELAVSEFSCVSTEMSDVALFKGSIAENSDYSGFFPYSNFCSADMEKVYFTLPEHQKYSVDNVYADALPMIAQFKEGELNFKNLCGILQLNLTGEGYVKKIVFRGYDEDGHSKPISGDASVEYKYDGEPKLIMSESASNRVILDCGHTGVHLSNSEVTPFYIVLPPGLYSTFEIEVSLTDNSMMIVEGVKPLSIERSGIVRTANKEFKASAISLCVDGSANSYIISEVGKYGFRLVRGNSDTLVENVSSVSVLWETLGTLEKPSKGCLIKEVELRGNYMLFNVASPFEEGNAVVAASDYNGRILWSWHIWLTDDIPEEITYANNSGIMMDRNLGATSAEPGSVSSLGLLYQWGRKDPFLGSGTTSWAYGDDDSKLVAASTISWPEPVLHATPEYTIEHPTTYVKTLGGNWFTEAVRDTLWNSSKTMYDPCPVGWRVPSVDIWFLAGVNNRDYHYSTSVKGVYINGSWYPGTGWRTSDGEYLSLECPDATYWAVDGTLDIIANLALDSRAICKRSTPGGGCGQSVRCQKEK